jgi:hypothetical protein
MLPDEVGARRPIFSLRLMPAADPAQAYVWFERILYSNLVETTDKHCHLQCIAALDVTG